VDRGADADVVHDLDTYPWPLEDESAERIEAIDVLEHLRDVVGFMDECWRVLRPDGTLLVQAVSWKSENLWRDPTHVRGFHADTLRYFDPESDWWRYGKLYTDRYWEVLHVVDGDNVVTELRPRKERQDSQDFQDLQVCDEVLSE
jgi:predicted SAM-dependent methyltransferase